MKPASGNAAGLGPRPHRDRKAAAQFDRPLLPKSAFETLSNSVQYKYDDTMLSPPGCDLFRRILAGVALTFS